MLINTEYPRESYFRYAIKRKRANAFKRAITLTVPELQPLLQRGDGAQQRARGCGRQARTRRQDGQRAHGAQQRGELRARRRAAQLLR